MEYVFDKAIRKSKSSLRYVQDGQKRCSVCEIFILCDKRTCPCCNSKLRSKSFRGVDVKQKYKEDTIKRY